MADTNCIDDGNMLGYSQECSGLPIYESDDIADIALSNIGEVGSELAANMGLIIILVIVSFIVGWAVKTKLTGTKLAK